MIEITTKGIDKTLNRINKVSSTFTANNKLFLQRLAEVGYNTAYVKFRSATYDGDNDVNVGIKWASDNKVKVVASGTSVLFIEFGSGLIGGGHPQAQQFGYGMGTWSDSPRGKGHWADPDGWYYEHGKKSKGNPPARAMYEAGKDMRSKVNSLIREVYKVD